MSWICDYCSTANDEELRECFVCGVARSAESIREAKRRLREEHFKKISASTYKWLMLIAKTLFTASTATFVIVFLIMTILKLTNGEVDDFASAIVGVGENAFENLKGSFYENFLNIGNHLSHSSILDMPSNFETIFAYIGVNTKAWAEIIGICFSEKMNIATISFVSIFETLWGKCTWGFEYWVTLFSQLFVYAAASCVGIKDTVVLIIKKIGQKFTS